VRLSLLLLIYSLFIFICVVISVLFCNVKGGFTFLGNKFDYSNYSYNKIYNYSSLRLLLLSFNARGGGSFA
jgi:hypothetical protein